MRPDSTDCGGPTVAEDAKSCGMIRQYERILRGEVARSDRLTPVADTNELDPAVAPHTRSCETLPGQLSLWMSRLGMAYKRLSAM